MYYPSLAKLRINHRFFCSGWNISEIEFNCCSSNDEKLVIDPRWGIYDRARPGVDFLVANNVPAYSLEKKPNFSGVGMIVLTAFLTGRNLGKSY